MAAEDQVRPIDHPIMRGHYSTDFDTRYVEAASQSWKKGAPLTLSSGKVAECEDDFTAGLIGFALADATGTEDSQVDILLPFEELELEGTLEDQSNGDHALVQANVGGNYALRQVAATGAWYLDENDTSNDSAYVVALVDPVGTVQGRVKFRIVRNVVDWA